MHMQMIAVPQAVEYLSNHAQDEELQGYCGSFSALAYLNSRFWQITFSDTKNRLRTTYKKVCQTLTFQLVHVPAHMDIWQNDIADHATNGSLCDIAIAFLNYEIYETASYALSPPHTTISKQT
jgi:hypothetical protein